MSNSTLKQQTFSFLKGGGEMGRLMRNKDWSESTVGTPDSWPQSLRTTLGIILNSKFPMFLWWGSELICFYNDAYRPSLGQNGKHPSILGMPAQKAWPEIWDIIKPLIDQVLAGGEATWMEDQLIPIFRNGKIEDVYWTFSYSPVNDESGYVSGVLVTCTETTENVTIRHKLEESKSQLEFAIEAARLGTWDLNPANGKFISNNRLKDWFGLPHEAEIELQHAIYAIAEKDRQRVINAIQKALDYSSGGHYEIEYTIIHPITKKETIVHAKGKAWFNAENIACRFNGTTEDVTEAVMARRKIEESEQKFRLLADSMAQHIWTADTKGNLNYYNHSVFNYSGLTLEEISKDGLIQIVHPDDKEGHLKSWMNSVKTGEDFLFEHRFRRHDGEYRWQLSRAVPQFDDNGNIQMWVGTSTDIHDIKKNEQLKDDFIKMASHELKTPVTTIRGYVQLLMEMYKNGNDVMLTNSLSSVDKHISKLTKLITDLLDVTKIETGSLHMVKENFQINKLAEEIIKDIQITTSTHKIIFDPDSDALVFADRDRISQVLINLLINSIKYSPHAKEVIIKTRLTKEDIVVSIRDFGIGIDVDDHDKIFERFYRVQGKNEKTYPGFGIGLFIVKEIISDHKGRIWVESKKNEGSVFYFSLPVIAS